MKKVLVVHSQLAQHGSEKLLYEICKILKSRGVDTSVLVRPFFIRNQYYHPLLRAIGVKIIFGLITFRHFTYFFKWVRVSQGVAATVVRSIYYFLARATYLRYYDRFDVIAIIGLETYHDTFAFLKGEKSKLVVHHVMHGFQHDRDYFSDYDLNSIVIGDLTQREEVLNAKPALNTHFFPLPVDFSVYGDRQPRKKLGSVEATSKRQLTIAAFSRLQSDRPNLPLFEHFAELVKVIPAKLHFFGAGDPAIYSRVLFDLGLSDQQIVFHGHSIDIYSSFTNTNAEIAWSVCMGESISYAAIELILYGAPVFFIDISGRAREGIPAAISPSISVKDTIDFHLKVLENPSVLESIPGEQYALVDARYNSVRLSSELLRIYGIE